MNGKLRVLILLQLGDEGPGAVAFGKVQAVAHHPHIRDLEAEVVDVGFLRFALFLGQHAGLDRGRLAGFQHGVQVVDRVSGVHDILDDQHVLLVDVGAQVEQDAHCPRRGGMPVAGQRHETM